MPDLNLDPKDENVIEIASFEVEHEDTFHLKHLYKIVHDFILLQGFTSLDTEDDKIETLYSEKVLPNGDKEHHIWWRAHLKPNKSKYFKYFLKFDFQTLYMGKKEMTYKGKKLKANYGDVIMRCTAYLMIDYDKVWRNHPILKYFYNAFLTYIYKNQIEYYKTDLWIKTYKLQDIIKQYLKLKTPEEMPEHFYDQSVAP